MCGGGGGVGGRVGGDKSVFSENNTCSQWQSRSELIFASVRQYLS